MFCEKCGSEFGDSQKFCGGCGTSLFSSVHVAELEVKPSKFGKIALWSFVIFVGLGYWFHAMVDATSDPQASSTVQVSTQPEEIPTPKDLPKNFEIGQPFSVGYWSYTCNKAFWTPFLGFDPYSTERANGDFIVLDLTVRNDDNSESTMPPFHLVDTDGRIYDESAAGSMSQGFFSVLEGLNPGVSKRGMVAFDVPLGRQYSLVASGGMESAEKVVVALPTYEAQKKKQDVPGVSY